MGSALWGLRKPGHLASRCLCRDAYVDMAWAQVEISGASRGTYRDIGIGSRATGLVG